MGSLPFWGEISLFCETQVFRLFDQPPSPRIRFPKQASMSSTLRARTPMRTVSRSNRVPSPRKRGTRSLKQRKFLIDAAASRLSLSPLSPLARSVDDPRRPCSINLLTPFHRLPNSTSGRAGAPLGLCPRRCQAGSSWWCRLGLARAASAARGGPMGLGELSWLS